MKISVNNQPFEVSGQRPLIEELRAAGIEVPSLCYAGGHVHHASCMVCMVKDVRTGQMLPSCSTMPREGMEIDTDSPEVKELRRMSLELLLSDHRADCEAPCTLVCPKGIDAAQVIWYYDHGMKAQAKALLQGRDCNDCAKTPCMKACRRGTVDNSVDIKGIIDNLAAD
ncbi:MAG: (2Fe-2S)-binding protein, partial [Bacteroidaceae bacterium]|nr:(2Fe-2S)-binding protein [Bacteroidaceae bacterium]